MKYWVNRESRVKDTSPTNTFQLFSKVIFKCYETQADMQHNIRQKLKPRKYQNEEFYWNGYWSNLTDGVAIDFLNCVQNKNSDLSVKVICLNIRVTRCRYRFHNIKQIDDHKNQIFHEIIPNIEKHVASAKSNRNAEADIKTHEEKTLHTYTKHLTWLNWGNSHMVKFRQKFFLTLSNFLCKIFLKTRKQNKQQQKILY